MADANEIRAALAQLDTKNNDQWTGDGLPAIDAVNKLVKGSVRRAEITEAAPKFTRDNPALEVQPLAPVTPPTAAPAASQDQGGDAQGQAPGGDTQEQAGDPNAGVAAQELEPLFTDPEDGDEELSILDAELAEVEAELAEAEAAVAAAQKLVAQAQAARDKVIEAREKARPANANMLGIQAYLERQKATREQKAARAMAILDAGIDMKMLQHRSPLDQAMARKTARGTQRPNINRG